MASRTGVEEGSGMPQHDAVYREKIEQAAGLLQAYGVDAWLIFVSETTMIGDPAMRLIVPFELTWESALLIGARGERTAIVGRFDTAAIEATSLFTTVIGYDASIRPALHEALDRIDPARIAIDYSTSDVACDGLTHGLYLRLIQH